MFCYHLFLSLGFFFNPVEPNLEVSWKKLQTSNNSGNIFLWGFMHIICLTKWFTHSWISLSQLHGLCLLVLVATNLLIFFCCAFRLSRLISIVLWGECNDQNSKYWYSSSFLSFFDLEYLNLILVKPFYYILLNFIDFWTSWRKLSWSFGSEKASTLFGGFFFLFLNIFICF